MSNQSTGYPAEYRIPRRNATGLNQPGRPMTPEQKVVALQTIRRWQQIIRHYLQDLEKDMNYVKSNQPVSNVPDTTRSESGVEFADLPSLRSR